MVELLSFEQRMLNDDGEFVLSRLAKRGEPRSWLVLAPHGAQPAAESQARLEHAYALRDLLGGPALTTPQAMIEHRGAATLLLNDPGGVSLASVAPGTLGLESVLRIGMKLAGALNALHGRGIMHKDLRPANVLVDVQSESVALTGFGRASRAVRERPSGSLAAITIDALGYLAPEQTGLMNRGVDLRCDLYSLGIVLYEMLTGVLPYRAASPMEWLHCHIAHKPAPLEASGRNIPRQVAAILERLLEKPAEARYQTALGLECDLRRCVTSLENTGAVEEFELGAYDTPDRLFIPERLYGREDETAALVSAFSRVATQGRPEALFISGYSGIGKSSLVGELRRELASSSVRIASGKFDQYKRDIPYATLAQAFAELIREVLDSGSSGHDVWRERLCAALGSNGQLVVNLIPELEQLIGPQPPVTELSPHEAQARFQSVLTRFIGAFCAPGHPLVLFLDDLQWLDAGTGAWLESIAGASAVQHLMLIGAYRDNEVGPRHALTRVIDTMRASGMPVRPVLLAPLLLKDVTRLLGDTLHRDPADIGPLAAFMFDKTAGNPFFVVQFLHRLEHGGLLRFDSQERVWRFDLEQIHRARLPEGVVDLMIERIGRMPPSAQARLRQFACIGNVASSATLARAGSEPEARVHASLVEAVEAGLVYRWQDGYAFVHDRIQEAAYATISPDARASVHLSIARVLSAHAESAGVEDGIFEIVNQYNRALPLISDPAERGRIVDLNLRAGRRAKLSSAYGSALTYLSIGTSLLGVSAWESDYPRKFALESNLAECEFLTGDAATATERLADLAKRVTNLRDRAVVTFLRITLLTALDQVQLAVQTCLDYLRHIGIEWEAHPGRDAARHEYDRLLSQIGSAPIGSLIDLPLLGDEELAATLNVLTAVLPPAFFSDENLVCLVLCRMANLSLAHGNSDASSLAYAYLGMVAGPVFGDYQAAFSFGRLGLALVDERGLDRFKARVYMCFAYHVTPWTQHIRTGLPLLRRAFDVANESGDLTYMGFSSCSYVTSLIAAGEPLAELEREARLRLGVVQAARFGLIVDIITSQLRLIGMLRGGGAAPDAADAADAAFSEEAFERRLQDDPGLAIAACWHWIRKQQWLFHADDIEGALAAGEKARPLMWTTSGHFEFAEYHFYAALVRARMHDIAPEESRAEHARALAEHHALLQIWARHCPSNFGGRAALVHGEYLRVEGRAFDAMRHYEAAIGLAHEHDFPHIEALAHEIAARFFQASQFRTIALVYWRNARRAYLRWGALAKIRTLDAQYPELVHAPAEPAGARGMVVEHFDAETVVKASQAISGEIVLEKLMRTLMTIVLQHAGANRAVLVLPNGEALSVEAEALSGPDGAEVRVQSRAVSARDVPLSIMHHALRTRESVLVDDAALAHEFSADEYFSTTRARSVLVLPITKQAKVAGALFMENDLAPGVFTAARITVLTLLASQAAISLENASLGHKEALLEEKEALLHEVHHRVKNNLQLISSLLNLQASRVTDREVAELFAESRNRVRSMAMVHENLYRAGNFARIMMAPHVRNLCAHLAQAYGAQHRGVDMRIAVDDVQFDMNRAVSCGLIINELVSNAFKHAFGEAGGLLRIALEVAGNTHCRLSVSDNGVGLGPAFSLEHAETLGLQLVHDLARQLHGSVEVVHAPGTTFTIDFHVDVN